MLNCNMMIRSLPCVRTEAGELPTYDGKIGANEFLDTFERSIPKQQQYNAME